MSRSTAASFVLGLTAVAFADLSRAQTPAPPKLESRELKTLDGGAVHADVGRVPVPENRAREGSRTLEIAVGRLRGKVGGTPLFFLPGGPGDSGSRIARDPRALEPWLAYLELGDLVFFDPRGVGSSKPSLAVELEPAPRDVFASSAKFFATATQAARTAKAGLGDFDPAGYTTVELADDVDALRAALGYEKIRLFGFSYGTHHALATLRRHGERVDAAVLVGTAGPNDIFKLPENLERSLAKLSELAARDARIGEDAPDLAARFRRLVAALDAKPLEVEVVSEQGERAELAIGGFGLALIVARDLGDTSDVVAFPRLFAQIERRDASMLAWFAGKRYAQLREFHALAPLCRTASGATAERKQAIAEQTARSPFGAAPNWAFAEMGRELGAVDLGDEFRRPVVSKTRTLFVSGTLDANTPPEQAEAVRAGFERSEHLVVENAGHEELLQLDEVHAAIRAFLSGEKLAKPRLSVPAPRFALLEGDDAQVAHPSMR